MRKVTSLLIAFSLATSLSACGLFGEKGSSSKVTGPSAPIILICNQDTNTSSGATGNTNNTNNCDRSSRVGEPVVEE